MTEETQTSDTQPEARPPEHAKADPSPSSAPEALVEQARNFRKKKKDKIVVMFRLPKKHVGHLSSIPAAAGLSDAYVLKAFAKEGRAALRAITSASDLSQLVATAKSLRATEVTEMTVGEAMTVYIQPIALQAMHVALDDPWMILPKATTAGAFLAAIVIGLIDGRLTKRASS